jgi:hypothetical protein
MFIKQNHHALPSASIALVLGLVFAFAFGITPIHAQESNITSSVDAHIGTPTRPPEPDSPGFTFRVFISNNGPEINNAILNIEIKTEDGEKVEQWFFENHNLGRETGQTVFWVPELPEETGTFRVAVGIFSAGWSDLLHWHEPAAIVVQNADGSRSIEFESHDGDENGDEPEPVTLSIWWPTDGVTISDTQPFKALLEDRSLDEYNMFWQVDGDRLNSMFDSHEDWPHKEAIVDLSGWNWRNSGPYIVNFIAQDLDGTTLAERAVSINTPSDDDSDDTVGDITICGRPGTDSFNACYYEGQNFETFKVQRDDGAELNFDWDTGSPHPVMTSDNFSAQWRGLFDFEEGVYEFTVTTDDGFRLFVDTELIIDEWHDQPATTYTVQKTMDAGMNRGVIAHYYENGGEAVAKLSWRKVE